MARRCRLAVLAAVTAVLVVAPTAQAQADDYVVEPGDTLIGIAADVGVRLTDLLRANHLTITSVIHPGDRLTVPGRAGGGSAPAAGGRSYTVQAGDSLYAIANRHGISLATLLRANRIGVTHVIHPGDRLTIPGTGAAPSTPQPTSPSGGRSYTVQAGDSLFAIANRHGISLATLLRANRIGVAHVIHPGDRLTIPGTGGAPPTPRPRPPSPSPTGGRSYTVQAGDSLYAIANRHGITLTALLRANDMAVTDLILPGMRLELPSGARVTPPPAGSKPVERVVSYARAQVGKPWRFFSRGPHAFDCSGLALAAYGQIGVRLVHHSASQANQGTRVDFPREPIRRGDLVFTNDDGGNVVNHVGIALNSTTWVHARAPGFGVQVNPIPSADVILAVRRFVPAG